MDNSAVMFQQNNVLMKHAMVQGPDKNDAFMLQQGEGGTVDKNLAFTIQQNEGDSADENLRRPASARPFLPEGTSCASERGISCDLKGRTLTKFEQTSQRSRSSLLTPRLGDQMQDLTRHAEDDSSDKNTAYMLQQHFSDSNSSKKIANMLYRDFELFKLLVR